MKVLSNYWINVIGIDLLIMSTFFLFYDKVPSRINDEIYYKYYQLEDKGWKSKLHSNKIDDITFTAVDVPLQYYLLKDLGNEDIYMIDSIYQAHNKEKIIEFSFEQAGHKDLLSSEFTGLAYQQGVEYMSFKIEKDFYIVTSKKDTISCSGVLFERNFKIAPFNKIILFFSNIDPNDDAQLVYTDNLFKKGTMKFKFKEKPTNLLL